MATLKKGSKGKPVEELQTLVNSNGISPKLKVDGIFGPLTEKGVKAAQKKLKIAKVDGVAGDETMAALRFGKPLPIMKAPDYSGELKKCSDMQKNTKRQEELYKSINNEIDAMNKAIDEIVLQMRELSISNSADLQEVLLEGISVKAHRKVFESTRLSKPATAESMAKMAYDSYLEAEKRKKQASDRLNKVTPIVAKKRKTVLAAFTSAEKHLAELEKAMAEGNKKLTALSA